MLIVTRYIIEFHFNVMESNWVLCVIYRKVKSVWGIKIITNDIGVVLK